VLPREPLRPIRRLGRPPAPAADVAGVAAALSTYLATHPDLNEFYTGLQDRPKDQIRTNVQN
jgi:heme-binding protein